MKDIHRIPNTVVSPITAQGRIGGANSMHKSSDEIPKESKEQMLCGMYLEGMPRKPDQGLYYCY
jgi:hypothetical protein